MSCKIFKKRRSCSIEKLGVPNPHFVFCKLVVKCSDPSVFVSTYYNMTVIKIL